MGKRTLRAFVASRKTVQDAGEWTDKRMPKSAPVFPLSKSKGVRLGAGGWRWRLVRIESDGADYRLLAMYDPGKQNYAALLGVSIGDDTLVLGALEYHSTHRGWHIHAGCKDTTNSEFGRLRYPSMRRIPGKGRQHQNRTAFPADDVAATEILAGYFQIAELRDVGGQRSIFSASFRDGQQ